MGARLALDPRNPAAWAKGTNEGTAHKYRPHAHTRQGPGSSRHRGPRYLKAAEFATVSSGSPNVTLCEPGYLGHQAAGSDPDCP